MKCLLLTLVGLLILSPGRTQEAGDHVLFHIERSRDANKIYYEANLDVKGKLHPDKPINIYWIKHAEHGQKVSLSWIQSHLAYGLDYISRKDESVEFRFVSYKDRKLILKQTKTSYAVFVQSDQGLVKLEKVFVKLEGDSFLFPSIPYVKLSGTDPQTQQKVEETIIR